MKVYSYLVEHDLGLAPNPFGTYCTLAVCKPTIRGSSKLEIGDWVIGTGSAALGKATGRELRDKMIYAMKISERVSFESYWEDLRFQYKKPNMNGALIVMFGDNFYHKDENGGWIQEDSAHCKLDGTCNDGHLKTDTGGRNVLISEIFYYFGDNAQAIPKYLLDICHSGVGQKILSLEKGDEIILWLNENCQTGIHGNPLNWQEYNQLRLF